jgi:hypothetical protein
VELREILIGFDSKLADMERYSLQELKQDEYAALKKAL